MNLRIHQKKKEYDGNGEEKLDGMKAIDAIIVSEKKEKERQGW